MSSSGLSGDALKRDGGGEQDPYRQSVPALLVTAALGAAAALIAGVGLADPLLVDAALALALAAGSVTGVVFAQRLRARPESPPPDGHASAAVAAASAGEAAPAPSASALSGWQTWRTHFEPDPLGVLQLTRLITAVGGLVSALILLQAPIPVTVPSLPRLAAAALAGLAGVALAATAARYLSGISKHRLPEASALARGARVIAWMFAAAAAFPGLIWLHQSRWERALHFLLLLIILAVCLEWLTARRNRAPPPRVYPLASATLAALGSRANLLASLLDTAERQLGIDLRSTWALTVLRRSLAPMLVGLGLLAWLSTCFTVVDVDSQGLLEHLGVPAATAPLEPGLHLHAPWPLAKVILVPVQQIQEVDVGHPGQEEGGAENVLWAVEHAPNEYNLVLGNGRDLVTIDAGVQYRITDPRAWHYQTQNPEEALRAIANRAVMKATVNHTLVDMIALNNPELRRQLRDAVQHDADELGLGVHILVFNVGAMHPPVPVAAAYEAVVSAELAKTTAVINAQVYRNQTVPAAATAVITAENAARAQGAQDLALAAGQSWSFRTLEAQYRVAPSEYMFRRRLETLESALAGLKFTVIDARYLRDGGELWFTP